MMLIQDYEVETFNLISGRTCSSCWRKLKRNENSMNSFEVVFTYRQKHWLIRGNIKQSKMFKETFTLEFCL